MTTVASSKSIRKLIKNSKGFTLVEMLVVLVITTVLIGLSWSGFMGLRSAMTLRQAALNLRADLSYAQRSAMLLNRGRNEKWVYGIGIDLRSMYATGSLNYSLFKWCSTSSEYQEYPLSNVVIPGNYLNGDVCSGSWGLAGFDGRRGVKVTSGELDFNAGVPGVSSYTNNIGFLVFESVNGRPSIYHKNNRTKLNFTSGQSIVLQLNRDNNRMSVVVDYSGQIYVDSNVVIADAVLLPHEKFMNYDYVFSKNYNYSKLAGKSQA
ncbi:prepilin-type N-terminal cleavage/methylation domain-containing protein [Candidatus Dojkabacteria bacterium]|nr:prepilin-type N-terminal cleavage/methylation domain-containing protein [Candidatus Dojkabacteria bacterium]